MPKGLLMVMTNVKDEAQDADFNDWYDNVHLSDVLSTPGVKQATRYELVGRVKEGRGKYLALYEVEADDLSKVMATMNETLEQRKAEGSVILHPALEVANFAIYQQRGETQVEK